MSLRTGRAKRPVGALYRAITETLETRRMLAAQIVGSPTIYATIQAAVNAAVANSTITVDAGVYSEQVTVSKTLTIRGAGAGVDARSNARSNTAAESVVNGALNSDGTRTTSFYLNANNIVLDGFTIEGQNATTGFGAAVHMSASRVGIHVLNNIVQNNATGVHLSNNSSTVPLIVRGNLFRNNNGTGPHSGRALYSDGSITGGVLQNVIIDNNAFVGNRGFDPAFQYQPAIGFEALLTTTVQTNIKITNNIFDNNGKHILAFNANNLTIQGNWFQEAWDTTSAGIRFEGGVHDVLVRDNNIYGSGARGLRIDRKASSGSNYNFTITNNNFFRNGQDGGAENAAVLTGESPTTSTQIVLDGPVNVAGNWWNSTNGPGGDWGTPLGSGDDVWTRNAGNRAFVTGANSFSTVPVVERQGPFWGTPSTANFNVQFEDYDQGGSGVAYSDTTSGNNLGALHHYESVDLQSTTDTGGGYSVGNVKAGEYLEYTMNVGAAGTYTFQTRVSSPVMGGNFHLEINGVNITGTMSVPNTGSATTWQTISKTGISLPAGTFVLRVSFDTNPSGGTTGNFNWFKFVPTSVQPAPNAPSNAAVTAPTSAKAIVTWTDNSTDENSFVIERRTGVAGNWGQVGIVNANVTSYEDLTVAAATQYFYRVRASSNTTGQSAPSNEAQVTVPVPPVTYLSDMNWVGTPINGWGPVERDMSVNGEAAGDGNVIKLNNVTYPKGLGAHAASEIVYNLGGLYSTFVSDIGVDDETGPGTVTFQVIADGVTIYDSGLMTQAGATKTVSVSVAGVQELKLVITNGGDNTSYDHADWADARLLASTLPAAPAAPAGLNATAFSPTQINLAWNDVANETGFKIERSTDNINFAQIGTTTAGVVTYNDTTVAGTTLYYYRVRASNAGGDSSPSNVASSTPVLPPAAASNLAASAVSQTQINLTWTDNANNETGFIIERSLNGVDGWTQAGTAPANATSFSNTTGLSAGTKYYYRVRPTGAAGDGANSNIANATTVAAPTAPNAPSNFNASPFSENQINLSWTDNSNNELNFIVERSLNGVDGWTQIATPAQNATSYNDADPTLTASTQYFYRIRATNAVGDSANASANGTTLAAPTAPAAASNLVATAASQTQINLTWTDNSGNETGFIVERSLNGVDSWTLVTTTAANATSYSNNTGLAAGTKYYYRVRATNAVGDGLDSNIASATTLAAPTAPAAASNLTATAISATQINLAWTDGSDNETGFKIERSLNGVDGWTAVTTTAANATTYSNNTGLVASTKYYYRVRATNAVGDAADSNIANATTLAGPQVPAAPSSLVATAVSQTQINLTWADNSSDETGFKIERSTDGVNNWVSVVTTAANATSYSNTTGLSAGTKYYYRVRAANGVGDSLNSNVANATTQAAPVVQYVSDLIPTSAINGYGPWEKDKSNGSSGTGDGRTMTLNGVTYAKGMGVHADSELVYNLAGGYDRFISDVGVDDETGAGTVVFQVFADGVKIYDSGTMTQAGATKSIDVSVLGVQTLRLVVTPADGSYSYDHADWAGTRLTLAPQVAPNAPGNLAATAAGQTQINLTWIDNANNETGFKIERSTDGVNFAQIGTALANATSYSDSTGLSSGTKYYYQVRANNSVGDSGYSNIANATTAVPTAPAAPSNLVAAAASTTQINLTWTDNSNNETGFIVERSLNGVDGWTQVGTPLANATSFSNTGLTASTKYYYRVRATNGVGPSADSAVANATTQAAPTAPAAPSSLVASAASASVINLTWADNSSNETGFIIERSANGTTGWAQVATPGANATSYSNTGLSASTQYFYRVRATNAVGPSSDSNTANATTLAAPALPSGWTKSDIGTVGAAGTATFNNGVFTISSSGADVWNTADSFTFVYTTWSGNGQIIAKVESAPGTHAYADAGVMIRESLVANSKHAEFIITRSQGAGFVRRTSTGGTSTVTATTGIAAPYWVKLIRNGTTITAYRSSDGTTWTASGSATVSMTANVFIGLEVTSHSTSLTGTATFSNVALSTSTSTTLTAAQATPVTLAAAKTSSLTFSDTPITDTVTQSLLTDVLA